MRMLTDNPTAHDRFGFKPYSEILANTIVDTNDLPFSIGIFGQWGAGKSSLMLMIERILNTNQDIKTIWFNPWKYDKKEELWSALIQSILYKIAEDAPNATLRKNAKTLAINAGWNIIKKSISSLTAGTISDENIESIKEVLAKQDELHYKYINQFEKDFENVVNEYTDNGKLVVFIDDLDRCLPENAITVLESLKLFIGNARCVFVLGMDQFIVEQGIILRFGNKVNMSGRDYLDKIIQVPFYLPPVPFNKLRDALELPKTQHYNDQIWEVVRCGLNGNPRKTKRFINCFYLAEQILSHQEIDQGDVFGNQEDIPTISQDYQKFYLSNLLIFQMVFQEFYEHLKFHPEDWELIYKQVINADSLEQRNQLLKEKPELSEMWNNQELKNYLTKIKGNHFPPPPSASIVESLLNAVTLLSESHLNFPRKK